MAEKLEAHYENRVYYFKIVTKNPADITIDMYGTIYTFRKKDAAWLNQLGNKMNMVQGLIDAVVLAADA